MKRIISILLENESGALSRVVGLFSQRGYNIDTLTVAPTDDDTLSRLTLTTQGDDHMACLLYTSPSPRDRTRSRMPSSA